MDIGNGRGIAGKWVGLFAFKKPDFSVSAKNAGGRNGFKSGPKPG